MVVFVYQLMAHRVCIHIHTLHSVIIDGHHQSAVPASATDVTSSRMALVSDQWHTIWSRVSQQQEVVNKAVGLWQRYRMQLSELRFLLTQTGEMIRANSRHDLVSMAVQRAQMTRLQVKMGYLVTEVMSCWSLSYT